MQHYVPGFILQECEEKRYSGTINAFVMFLDIADFTETSDRLRRLGSKGAEALSNYLTAVFTYPIMQVESQGGFISHFAGDAFCAIFPGFECRAIRQALSNIQDYFTDNVYHDPEFGDFPISIRLTLTQGEVKWRILQSRIQCEYVFFGQPMQEIYNLSKHKSPCMLSEAVLKAFAADPGETLDILPFHFDYSETTRQLFTIARLVDLKVENEIRDAAYCFVDLSRIEESRLEEVMESIHNKLEDYSGFLNKIDATDKGLVALVLFGLPRAIGNTLERMCRFALEMITEEPKLSMGLACGSAYTGYVGSANTREFTSLGSAVNLASRLMQLAEMGEIATDSYLQQEMHYKYSFAAAKPVKLKGFTAEVHAHKLLGRLPRPPQSFHTDFVGREAEIESLRQEAEQPGSRIVYISGEPGMGKSRLIVEALKPFPKGYFLFSDPSVHRLLEPIKQLVGQYFVIDPLFSKQRKLELFRQQWQELAQDDKELIRIESIIGQLLGYEWERSVWSVLPPEEKPEQLKNALVSFVCRITRDAKLIIHLDDPQWIDDSTLEIFRLLGEKNVAGVTVFAACRYQDDGSVVDLEIPNWESKHVDLEVLTPETAELIVRQILGVERIPQNSLDWIIRKADGNPLFLEQVVAYLQENNCFDKEHKLVGNLDYLSSFGIADIIGSRIDSLTENVRNTLQHACVLGLEFNTRVLCEMLSRKLDEDLGKGKQAKVWADLDELRYIFTHVLIKDTAYNRMLSDKLKGLHLLAAKTMVELYQDDEKALNEHAEEIAIHFEEAGDELEAAMYYDMAGTYYCKQYKYNEADKLLNLSLDIRKRILGDDSEETLDTSNNLATLYAERGCLEQAEDLLHSVMKRVGSDGAYVNYPRKAKYIDTLACLYYIQGKLKAAEPLFIKAIEIHESSLGSSHPDTAASMHNLAALYRDMGNYNQSEELFNQALTIKQSVHGQRHASTAETLHHMAVLYVNQGKYETAESLHKQALSVRSEILSDNHPTTAESMNSLADLYRITGNFEKAEPLFLRALNITENILGSDSLRLALVLNDTASLYCVKKDFDSAELLFKKCLDIYNKVLGQDHIYTAAVMNNMGYMYRAVKNYTEAESMLKMALATNERVYGFEHPETGKLMNNLGHLLYEQGKDAEAEPFLVNAVSIRKKTFGAVNPQTQLSIKILLEVYEKLGRPVKAEEYRKLLVEQ